MGGVKIVLKNIKSDEGILFEYPTEPFKTKLKQILKNCEEKTNGYVSLEINRPYKPRTTGEKSQNNLVWKLITIIAQEMGEDTEYVENLVKIKATAKGYPYKTIEGQIVPSSMTKINTVECSYLIDTCYEMIAFLGIILPPEMTREEPKINVVENEKTMQSLGLEYEESTDEFLKGDIF